MTRKKIETKTADNLNNNIDTVKGHEVSNFLQANPDFFVSQPELLTSLTLPSIFEKETKSVVDFQLYQLEKRSAEIDELRNCAEGIIETNRCNMSAQTRTHAAVLALIQVTDIEQLIQVAIDDLPILIDIDSVMIGFEEYDQKNFLLEYASIKKFKPNTIEQLVDDNSDAKLYAEFDKCNFSFDTKIDHIKSAAVARLRLGERLPKGMLMLGSQKKLFHPNQGTELIVFLARVFQSCLLRFWHTK